MGFDFLSSVTARAVYSLPLVRTITPVLGSVHVVRTWIGQQSLSMTKRFFARRWPGKAAGGICGAGASSGGGSNGGGCGTGAGPGAGAAVAEAAPWTPPWRRRLPGPPPAVSRPRTGRRGRSHSRGGGPKSRTVAPFWTQRQIPTRPNAFLGGRRGPTQAFMLLCTRVPISRPG